MKSSESRSIASIGRRDFLASAGAVTGGLLMAHEASGEQNLAVNVQDRGSLLRISAVSNGFKDVRTFCSQYKPYWMRCKGIFKKLQEI